MRVINQGYCIERAETWQSMLERVEEAGRTCYLSEPRGEPEKFIAALIKSGHLSVIEHASLTVRFYTDRGVTHELVRHRLAAYSQESTRYCDYGSGEVEFIRPVWVAEKVLGVWDIHNIPPVEDPDEKWLWASALAEEQYKSLRNWGWSPQQARAVLPNSLKTEIVMTANLREWRHVLQLRCSKAAHPQMRELMLPLLAELKCNLPCIFGDLKP